MHRPDLKRRNLLLAALAAPVLPALHGCATPLPVSLNAATTPAAQAVLTRLYREAGPEMRLRMALQMSDECRRITTSGIRARMPDATEEQVRCEVARLYLGDELAQRAFGARST